MVVVDLATFNKTWACCAGPGADAAVALVPQKGTAGAELCEHSSSLGTVTWEGSPC